MAFFTWVNVIWNHIWSWLWQFPVAIFDICKDVACWGVDSLLTAAEMVGSSASLPQSSFSGYWSSLPVEIAGMASLLGIVPALSIIVSAMAVRFVLAAIPFVGWGR